MSPINDTVAGYERPEPIEDALYQLQNAYLSACIETTEAEEKYVRHEIGAEQLKMAYAKAETALGALEKYWATIGSQAKKDGSKS